MTLLIQGEEAKYSYASRKITETKEPATLKLLKNLKLTITTTTKSHDTNGIYRLLDFSGQSSDFKERTFMSQGRKQLAIAHLLGRTKQDK